MIFLSHTYADKPIVEPIALKLREMFGEESVFYDAWSIQPGDGIIDKMNEGLSDFRFFFYFVYILLNLILFSEIFLNKIRINNLCIFIMRIT